MDKFVLFKNNNNNLEKMWIVIEKEFLCIVCFVDGNLMLIICLFKGNIELVKNINILKWINNIVIFCEDMNNYICEGSFNWFNLSN